MESILLVIHVIIALLIIGLIMLQQGKGAEMGASFGAGSSQTVFGSAGSGNFFSRMTAILVAAFFVTSFVLAMIAQNRVDVDDVPIPAIEKVVEEDNSIDDTAEVPTLDASDEGASIDEDSNDVPSLDAAEAEQSVPELESGEEDSQ